jgi:hypothetical protein
MKKNKIESKGIQTKKVTQKCSQSENIVKKSLAVQPDVILLEYKNQHKC